MKRVLSTISAMLLASAVALSPALAKNGGNGNGNGGNDNSAAAGAPGQMKGDDTNATGFAPGQIKGDDESAKSYAPGQTKGDDENVDPETTASTGKMNFGRVISSIRAGKSNFSGVEDDAEVNIVDIDDLTRGNNRSALENALDDNADEISNLRADLADLDLENLSDADADRAIAAQVEDDGSLTVVVD